MVNPLPIGKGLPTTAPDTNSKLKKECVEFEGQFFSLMLKEMRKTVPPDSLLGDDSNQQDIFQSMMDDHIAQDMAQHGGSNSLAEQMYTQLLKHQANAPAEDAGKVEPISLTPKAAPLIPLKNRRGKADNEDE